MFDASNIIPYTTVDEIFKSISEYDIFKKYVKNFEEINKDFKSEFYTDNRASCRIYQNSENSLRYKDHGNKDSFNCFYYVMHKFGCTFIEASNIISCDFGLIKTNNIQQPILVLNDEIKIILAKKPIKSTITIIPRQWTYYDYEYWNQFGISFEWLDSYDVIPCSYVYLNKGDKTIVFEHKNNNPMYAYRFINDGKYNYKIYKPLSPDKKYKWLFSGESTDIEGFDQLPYFDDLLIITKSLKDVICCRILDYSAISLQGEGNKLSQELVNKLQKRFKKIILMYDNDECGLKCSKALSEQYGFKSIVIPLNSGNKDLAEYIRDNGLNQAKRLLKHIINN